jgi:hypothetical protein
MKNVSFIRLPNGKRRLVDNDGVVIDAFTRFQGYLKVKCSIKKSSIIIYEDNTAQFINYLIEAGVFMSEVAPTEGTIDKVINSYPEYLVNGKNSEDTFVTSLAIQMNYQTISADGTHIAAINHFLKFAQNLAKEMKQLAEIITGVKFDSNALIFSSLDGEVKMSRYEIMRIKQNSIVGANLRHIKPSKKRTLKSVKKPTGKSIIDPKSSTPLLDQTEDVYVKGKNMDFPLSRFQELLENEPSPRNRCLWSLLGGGGLRQSEGVATLDSLVFLKEQIVRIIDPSDWRGSSKYPTPHRFKGRMTAKVYIIPVYRKIFFDSYVEWKKIKPLSSEDYTFLKVDRDDYGQPLHLATYKALNDAFKKAQKRIGMKKLYTLHSLRHMYGVFMHNYFPTPWKRLPGLDLADVQTIMGHASAKSTKVYARQNDEVLEAKLEMADRVLMGDSHLSLPEMIVNNLRIQADSIEEAM